MIQKPERLAAAIQRSIGEQLLRRFPGAGLSVAYVRVSSDVRRAVVWVSALEGDPPPKVQEQVLAESGRLRAGLSSHARVRRLPVLEFLFDDSWRIK